MYLQDDRPLLLACHDMAGGYHEDAHLHGTQASSAYRHCHWQATDIFCYFSHSLVTIPPPGWTTAAHRNNTMVGDEAAAGRVVGISLQGWNMLRKPTRWHAASSTCTLSLQVMRQVLGTFITEWEAGTATCRELFGSAAAARHTAQQLARIAACYGFEGWLINIENNLDTSTIEHVLIFLRYCLDRPAVVVHVFPW